METRRHPAFAFLMIFAAIVLSSAGTSSAFERVGSRRAYSELLAASSSISSSPALGPNASSVEGNGCFADDFSSTSLDSRWLWVDPLRDSGYDLTSAPGSLRLSTPDRGHDLDVGWKNTNSPRLVQPISGDFDVSIKVVVNPVWTYQSAGLLVWIDSSNFIWLGRSVGALIHNRYARDGRHYDQPGKSGILDTTVYFREVRTGNTFASFYSLDGRTWIQTGSLAFSSAPATVSVGLFLINNWQDHTFSANFDYFRCTAAPVNSVVNEARLDIGMPYDANRGCPDPFVGCGGAYHGFFNGVCTDVVLDAYRAGISFNVQAALEQDYRAHPARYRWGSARNAEDMRQYFSYQQQLLSHSQAYQLGDVAFFDWEGDGITNHVNIISEVDANGRPLKMVDATGAYTYNPGGRALEHAWTSYYDTVVQVHGRPKEGTGSVAPASLESIQTLRIAVNSPSVALRLQDANGKTTSASYDSNLVATNIEAFIPYIPRGSYAQVGATKVITVTQPLANTDRYFIELTGLSGTEYQLNVQAIQDGKVSASRNFVKAIGQNETQRVALQLSAPSSGITFSSSAPTPSPNVAIMPAEMAMTVRPHEQADAALRLTELGNQLDAVGVKVEVSELTTQMGTSVVGASLLIRPATFDLPAGGTQDVQLEVSASGIAPGLYQGSLVITSTNGSTHRVPFSLAVEPVRVFLPLSLSRAP